MLIEKDLSELNDNQKQDLLLKYLNDLAASYLVFSMQMKEMGDPISKEFATQLVGKEQEVLRLRSWMDAIVTNHIGRKMGDALNQSVRGQLPPEGDEMILKRAMSQLEELRSRWSKHPPARLEHLPMVEVALRLVESLATNFYVSKEALGGGKQTR